MKKILIAGCSGAGKSTLARSLGKQLQLPVYHLDAELWKPGWIMSTRAEEKEILTRLLRGEAWIIDGNYGSTLPVRLQACDTVIVLDFPRYLCLWRIIKRWWFYRGKVRPDMAEGCPEKIDWEFVCWVWNYRKTQRERVLEFIEKYGGSSQVLILKSPKAVRNFTRSCKVS